MLMLVSQVSFAAHQFEHPAEELHETCAVCLLFERNEELLAAAEAAPLSSIKSPPVTAEIRAVGGTQDFCHYLSRASPESPEMPA